MYLLQFWSDSNDQNVIRRAKFKRIFPSLESFVDLSAFESYKFIPESSPVSPVSPVLGSPPPQENECNFRNSDPIRVIKTSKEAQKLGASFIRWTFSCISANSKNKILAPPPHFSPVSPVLPSFQENEWISVSFDPIFVFKTVPKIINSGPQLAPSTFLSLYVEGWKFVHAPQEPGT